MVRKGKVKRYKYKPGDFIVYKNGYGFDRSGIVNLVDSRGEVLSIKDYFTDRKELNVWWDCNQQAYCRRK